MTNTEIQAEEYVRTKKHGIFKVTKIYETESKYYILNNDKYETYTIGGNPRFDISKDIVNHSFNLIDLIEVGDYVNGCLVEAIDYEEDEETGGYHNVLGIWEREDDYCYGIELSKLPIRRIVTKEQFKSMEYKVGGEND